MVTATARRGEKPQGPSFRNRLDPQQVEDMLAILVRNRSAFVQARQSLDVAKVGRHGAHLAIVWRAVNRFFDTYGDLPAYGLLCNVISDEQAADDTVVLTPPELTKAKEFLEQAFDFSLHRAELETSATHAAVALDVCRRYVEECVWESRQAMTTGGQVPEDLVGFLDAGRAEVQRVADLGRPAVARLFPDGWDNAERPVPVSTCLTAIDKFTGGGILGGELLMFFGPYGSCKSLAAVRGCGLAAKACEKDGLDEVVVFVSTEMDDAEFRYRLLAGMASIPWKRVRQTRVSDLSTSSRPAATEETKYEAHLYSGEKKSAYAPERDRMQRAIDLADKHVLFINFTENNPRRPLGAGGVPELLGVLESALRDWGVKRPQSVWIDHLSAMARRALVYTSGDFRQLRFILGDMPRQVAGQIAKKREWLAPVFMTHQFSGEANSRAPTALLDHTDAAECKTVAEFADWAVTTGQTTQDARQLCVWRCTKHRREPPAGYCIVRVVGEFASVDDVSDNFLLSPSGREIVHKADLTDSVADRKAKAAAALAHAGVVE